MHRHARTVFARLAVTVVGVQFRVQSRQRRWTGTGVVALLAAIDRCLEMALLADAAAAV
jgi:hypothetical protein